MAGAIIPLAAVTTGLGDHHVNGSVQKTKFLCLNFCPGEKSLSYQRDQKRSRTHQTLHQRRGTAQLMDLPIALCYEGRGFPWFPLPGCLMFTVPQQQQSWIPPNSPPAGHTLENRPQNFPDSTKNVGLAAGSHQGSVEDPNSS